MSCFRPRHLVVPCLLVALAAGCQLLAGTGEFTFGADSGGGEAGSSAGGHGGSASGGQGGEGGGPEMCSEPSECPGIESTCLYRSCDEGVCGLVEAPAATACSDDRGSLCNEAGVCVACLTTADCNDASLICQDQACVPAGCANNQLDGNETDLDCGGDCAPCADGLDCVTAADCVSGFCSSGSGGGGAGGGATGGAGGGAAVGSCAPCSQHGDCGPQTYCAAGGCVATKTDGDACSEAAACDSGFCVDGVCCESACSGECRACKGTKTGGVSGACLPIPAGDDPDNECLLACNGNGSCQLL